MRFFPWNNKRDQCDEARNHWTFAYNQYEKVGKIIDPLQHSKQLICNLDARPIQFTDEAGKNNYAEYDNEGRLLSVIDGASNEIIHHYDQTPTQQVNSQCPSQN